MRFPTVKPKITVDLPFGLGEVELEANETEQKAAWSLYVQLTTRIATQALASDEGVLRDVLNSLYPLFELTRKILEEAGPQVAHGEDSFGPVAMKVLNEGLRPFNSKWHPLLLKHEGKKPDDVSVTEHERAWEYNEAMRQELKVVQSGLETYVTALAQIAGVQEQIPQTLLETIWPARSLIRDVVVVVLGIVLTAAASWVVIIRPEATPIIGQTFGVLIVGAVLGSRLGTISMLIYLILGGLGLPIFAGGASGWDELVGQGGGYLVGFVPAAFVVGWLCERGWGRDLKTAVGAMLAGTIVIHLFGWQWLSDYIGREEALSMGLYPLITGDLIRIILAAIALIGGWALAEKIKS